METDCPLRESNVRKHFAKLFNIFQNRRKTEHKTEDIIQMKTDIVLTDKDGKFIEVKVPELGRQVIYAVKRQDHNNQ